MTGSSILDIPSLSPSYVATLVDHNSNTITRLNLFGSGNSRILCTVSSSPDLVLTILISISSKQASNAQFPNSTNNALEATIVKDKNNAQHNI